MSDMIFPARPVPQIPLTGDGTFPAGKITGGKTFPVGKIFCVGRNYAAHAAEMGHEVDREAPFYFTKSAHTYLPSGQDMPYPPRTNDLHHEMELVVAIGARAQDISVDDAMGVVLGYACGLDMTRRDLQAAAKDKRRPWDTGKDFDNAAIIAPITPASAMPDLAQVPITLHVNGALRQSAFLGDMVWSIAEIIADLSTLYTLLPGDLIMTGTPAGVGPVQRGDLMEGRIGDLAPVVSRII
jgi:fumarylpyruvate hydrolase